MDPHTPKILSLCSGIGGIDLGIKLALPLARTVCYVEREAYPCAVLVRRMQEGLLDEAPLWSNIETFDGRPWRRRVDIVIGGFPCQPWSCAGKREGVKDKRWIWDDLERILRQAEPGWVFLENVPGLCKGGIERVLGSLASMGYDAEWGVFSASQVGASHRRERLFILACLANANGIRFEGAISSQNVWANSTPGLRLGGVKRPLLFPPGPEDKQGWRKILRETPVFKPAFCGVAHGPSVSMGGGGEAVVQEEIRAVGNGVVPLAVAFAFIILANRLMAGGSVCNPHT